MKRNRNHRPNVDYANALLAWRIRKQANPNLKEKAPRHPAANQTAGAAGNRPTYVTKNQREKAV